MNLVDRATQMRAARTTDDPCPRTTPHMAHRNWHSAECGVCSGVAPEGAPMPRTVDHTTRAHTAFIRHKKTCTNCSPVPTIGPCPTGLELRSARDAAALDFLEDTVRSIPTVAFTCRNPCGQTIVHFTAPGRVVGGVAYRPHEGSPWVVSVGVKVGPLGDEFTHHHGSAHPEAHDIASTVTEIVGGAQGPSRPQDVPAPERIVDVPLPGMHDLTA